VSQPWSSHLAAPAYRPAWLDAPTVVLPRAVAPRTRIPEIDGLRGVAIALIVVYHVWLNRVSGGVDVFFLLSGFLITMTLVRSVEHQGRVRLVPFYARVARRIVPPALTVLVGVVVASIVFLPQVRWRGVVADVVAAALYGVNWHLGLNAVDYLASRYSASPVQHYWSLAVQAQFYLVWPLLVIAAVALARQLAVRPRRALAVVLGVVFVTSLAYSVYRTATSQAFTYFDTAARLWEFALGGLLLLALPHLRLRARTGLVLGWLAIAALVACGLVLRAGTLFPGYAALWPTVAAALLILTAGDPHPASVGRLLRTGPLKWLGDLSYSLYLTHWPVLICYLAATGRSQATLRGGVLVIVASLALAIGVRWLVEQRLPASGLGQRTARGGLALSGTFIVVGLLATGGWTTYIDHQQRQEQQLAHLVSGEQAPPDGRPRVPLAYPGAAYLAYGGELLDLPYRPGPLAARDDRAGVLYPGCHQTLYDPEVLTCEIGPSDAERTIAVVGGSHAQHWLPALEVAGERHGWRIVAMTKSGCLLSTDEEDSCREWNDNVITELARLSPDAVFTTATRVLPRGEELPSGYIDQWWTLNSLGLPVIGIRDTPRPGLDVPECVEVNGPDSRACGRPAASYGLDQPSAAERYPGLPDNVRLIDLTRFFCVDGFCPAVIGNVLVYHDGSHLTATYARTLAPFLADAIIQAMGWEPEATEPPE
jgi:peptidoglycan/LPS O-acetylase OafA/YrhL